MAGSKSFECTKCNIVKLVSEFYKRKDSKRGHRSDCKECHKEYRIINKSSIDEYKVKYYKDNRAAILKRKKLKRDGMTREQKDLRNEKDRLRRESNKQEFYRKRRVRRNKPINKLKDNVRRRINIALKVRTEKSVTYLGTSIKEYKRYLESMFTEGMSWDNYGEWHIDHIIPLASAKTEEELIKLFHYSNTQPLWAKDNLKKSCKV